jgi:hypothetical protein
MRPKLYLDILPCAPEQGIDERVALRRHYRLPWSLRLSTSSLEFQLNDLGIPRSFLGIQFDFQADGSVSIHQHQYIRRFSPTLAWKPVRRRIRR